MNALLLCPFLSAGTALPQNAAGRGLPAMATLTSAVDRTNDAMNLKLTLRVYNYAKIDSASLSSSEKVADAIFHKIGIEALWVNCPLSEQQVTLYPACLSLMGTSDLVVKILPLRMAAKLHRSNDPLGFAQTCSESEPACELNIFDHPIEELATHGYRADRIMGYAFAHEIAHVLIGRAHSDEGIMRAAWTAADLQRISLGLALDFTPAQSSQLQCSAMRRN